MGHWDIPAQSDEWFTPKYIFDALGAKFNMDVAAPKDLSLICVPAKHFITENSLESKWRGFVFMNPPFGGRNGIVPWLDKFIEHGNGICLTPDRTSAAWWQYIASKADAHFQIKGKVKFTHMVTGKGNSPSNGTTLFAFGYKAIAAFLRAEKMGLGITFYKARK